MADEVFRPGWDLIEQRCHDIAQWAEGVDDVFGVPRGGCVPAAIIATRLELPLVEAPGPRTLVVDDLVDSGATMRRYVGLPFAALYRKPWSPVPPCAVTVDAWIEFPWEVNETPGVDAVLRLLQRGGLDTSQPQLLDAARKLVDEIADVAVSLVARRLTQPGAVRSAG